jgi:glycosyltransferase involved in cell wall biosynthesis
MENQMGLSKLALELAEKVRPVLVRVVPQKVLTRVKARMINRQARELEKQEIIPFEPSKYKNGINLIGSVRSDTGLGQSIRLLADIIEEIKCDYMVYNYFVPPGDSMTDTSYDYKISDNPEFNVNLIHVNPSELPLAYMDIGKQQWDYHYNIGYWLWELEDFPDEWLSSLHFVDEIWTSSEFVARSIRKCTDKPVHAMPYCVTAPVDESCTREHFGLPDDKFLYLMMFNSGSVMARKNPMSVLAAFKKAFPKEQEDVGLIIKMNSSAQSEKDMEQIKSALDGYDNIYFICETLSKAEVDSLIKCADVYVSLHRAEGFGLVMAEAMLLGTPVIATNWSANTEFMSEETSCMVDYRLVTLEEDIFPFKKGYRWAEADTDEAAGFMRRLYEDKAYYEEKRKVAAAYVREKLSMQCCRQRMKDRLDEIWRK